MKKLVPSLTQVIALLVAVFCAVAESRILHRVRRQQQPSASNLKRDSLGPIIYADDKADPGYAAPHKVRPPTHFLSVYFLSKKINDLLRGKSVNPHWVGYCTLELTRRHSEGHQPCTSALLLGSQRYKDS